MTWGTYAPWFFHNYLYDNKVWSWLCSEHMDFIVLTCFNMFLQEVNALYLRYFVLNSLDPQGGRVGSL